MDIQRLTALVAAAVTEQSPPADAEVTQELYTVSRKHDVAHLVAYSLRLTDVRGDPALKEAFELQMLNSLFRYEKLNYEYGRVCQVLEEAEIAYMPLKGAVLRELYPDPMMRTSCDTDILVHPEDVQRAADTLAEKLSYTVGRRTAHDITLSAANGTHTELHFDLIEDERINPHADRILGEVWQRSAPQSGTHRYVMDDDMFYFYHIAHMAKHILLGGCGIRPFADLLLLEKTGNRERRDALLVQGGLKTFADAARALTAVWFAGAPHTDATRRFEQYIISGGTYGTMENHVSAQQTRTSSKVKYVLERIWLPEKQLIARFPQASGRKWTYPYYQFRRWLYVFSSKTAKRSMAEMKALRKNQQGENPIALLLRELELSI